MSKILFDFIVNQEMVAKDFGFYWESIDQLIDQIKSECEEIREAYQKGDREHLKEEVGDLLNAAVSLAIYCQCDPHEVLKSSADKFQERYDRVVKLVQKEGKSDLKGQPMEVLMRYWDQAKKT